MQKLLLSAPHDLPDVSISVVKAVGRRATGARINPTTTGENYCHIHERTESYTRVNRTIYNSKQSHIIIVSFREIIIY